MRASFELYYNKFEQLSRLYRTCLLLFVLALISIPYIYFVIMPGYENLNEVRFEKENLEKRLNLVRQKARLLEKYRKLVKNAEEDFKIARQVLPDNEEMRKLLKNVSKAGVESGLEFTLFKPEQEQEKHFYAEIPVSLKIIGTYHNLAIFFDKISKMPRIVNIEEFKINQQDTKNKEPSSLLNIECKALTYKFLGKEAHEKKN